MLPCVLGIFIGLAGWSFELLHAGNGHAAGWALTSALWAFVASWTWRRPERRRRVTVGTSEMGGEAGFYRPLGNQRTPPFMARLRYHPTAVRNEPGLYAGPAAIFLAGLVLAWAAWALQGLLGGVR